jgi:hypothetical protein
MVVSDGLQVKQYEQNKQSPLTLKSLNTIRPQHTTLEIQNRSLTYT